MKKYFWILLIIIFLTVFDVRALDVGLNKSYDNDFKKCYDRTIVLPSYDDSGKISGHLFYVSYLLKREISYTMNKTSQPSRQEGEIIKLDLNNKVLYEKTDFTPSDLDVDEIEGENDSETTDLLITRYDEDDEIIFEVKYAGSGSEVFHGYCNSYNDSGKQDGYLIFLLSNSTDLKAEPGFIMLKYDLKGNLVLEKNINEFSSSLLGSLFYFENKELTSFFNFSGSHLYKRNVSTGEDVFYIDTNIDIASISYSYDESSNIDGIVLVGYSYIDDSYVGTIVKYDLTGKEIFRKTYDKEFMFMDVLSNLYVDGKYDGYIVTASSYDNGTMILKYDLKGNLTWSTAYADEDMYLGIVKNYNSSGNPNGFLVYEGKYISFLYDRKQMFNKNSSSYEVKRLVSSCSYKVSKYTYDDYPVIKKETVEGNISVSNSSAFPGEIVSVKVVARDGYTLKRIVVTDEDGKEIEVSNDGTFVMPEGKVTVTAIYSRITNPETVSACYVVLGIILLICIGTLIVQKKKES